MKKMLVVYYSWSNGNTEKIALSLQKATGADIAKIETLEPYKGSYDDVVSEGQREVNRGYMRPIKPLDADMQNYDVIAVGTPTWWYTMAPAVKTFLNSQKWEGKTVVPFMTNGGWPGHVIKDIEKECKGAKFLKPMEIQFDSTGGAELVTPQGKIDKWIEEVKKSL